MKLKLKHIIVWFFLTVFISVKMSNLHAFLHIKDGEHNKVEHCDVCKFVLSQDLIPALTSPEIVFIPLPVEAVSTTKISGYTSSSYNKLSQLTLYNKPPPIIG